MTESQSFSLFKSAILLAVLASFFIATAPAHAETLFGPSSTTVGNAVEYSTGPIDVSQYSDLHLTFNYVAEKLDPGDSFTYGWRSAEETILGTFTGLADGASAVPGDETGVISLDLPAGAAVSDLQLFIKVTANSTIENDSVEIADLLLSGTVVILDVDANGVTDDTDNCVNTVNPDQSDFDNDGEGDLCDGDDDNDGIADGDENEGCAQNTDNTCGVVVEDEENEENNEDEEEEEDVDEDNDGVIEGDLCPNTRLDEAGKGKLNLKHWRYNGHSWTKGQFGWGKKNSSSYTMMDTRGCSCDQIGTLLQKSKKHSYKSDHRFGCSPKLMEEFLEYAW